MAITTNTRKTLTRSSTVLAPKCEETQRNLDKLLEKAGVKPPFRKALVPIPTVPGDKDDVIFVSINGAKFYFQRGKAVTVPEVVMMQMVNCGMFPEEFLALYAAQKKDAAQKKEAAKTEE